MPTAWPALLLTSSVLAVGFGLAASSKAANQQYQGSLVIESFGDDVVDPGGYPPFSVYGLPQGVQCNPFQPRCNFASTPVTTIMGVKEFWHSGLECEPITYFGVTTRPAKGATPTTGKAKNVHHRNPGFFTPSGAPNATSCRATSTVSGAPATMFLTTNSPKRGKVMKGAPLTGEQIVTLSGSGPAGFELKAAPTFPVEAPGPTGFGLRRTTSGEFFKGFPYGYSYTYATLRNDDGKFFGGGGPGDFALNYYAPGGKFLYARIAVKAGANRFGGVMRLLGQLTTRVCYFRLAGCSLGSNDGRYDAVGNAADTSMGIVTAGYVALHTATVYHTVLMQPSTVMVRGYRFPWTTGSVSVSALMPHGTVRKRHGYDERTALGKGTIQLVTPVLTRWAQPGFEQFTGGVGILRLRFVPEPAKGILLAAGLSLLGVLYRWRRR